MNSFLKGVVAIAAISLPGMAFAQSSDAAYCQALVSQYEHYLDSGLRFGEQPQSLQSKTALVECKAGDARGIPGLEQALRDAKIDLPARNAVPAAAATSSDKNCGVENWSTDQMMYVGVPCNSKSTYDR